MPKSVLDKQRGLTVFIIWMVMKIATIDCLLSGRYLSCVTGENIKDIRKIIASFPQIYWVKKKRTEVGIGRGTKEKHPHRWDAGGCLGEICQWTLWLLPCFSSCKYYCNEHGCTNISSRPCFNPLRYTSRSGIAGLYGNSMFKFLRNCHTVFHSGYTISHSHPEMHKIPNSL